MRKPRLVAALVGLSLAVGCVANEREVVRERDRPVERDRDREKVEVEVR
jgi:hypothetical protein